MEERRARWSEGKKKKEKNIGVLHNKDQWLPVLAPRSVPVKGYRTTQLRRLRQADDKNEGGEQASCENDKHEEEQPQKDDTEEWRTDGGCKEVNH